MEGGVQFKLGKPYRGQKKQWTVGSAKKVPSQRQGEKEKKPQQKVGGEGRGKKWLETANSFVPDDRLTEGKKEGKKAVKRRKKRN